MTIQQAASILHEFNRWRRGAEIPQPNPTEIGKAIDLALEVMKREARNNSR